MTLLLGDNEERVKALLDPGCSVPIFSLPKARKLGIPLLARTKKRAMYGFNNKIDAQGGRYYTAPVILRHSEDHFTRLSFELTDIGDDYDLMLPYWWLQQHQPSEFWNKEAHRISFASPYCREHCTSRAVLGITPASEAVAASKVTLDAALAKVPEQFREFIPIMSEEAALRLPDHQPWDHQIDIIEGKSPPWGPLFAMSARELNALKPWLDKMLKSGRIRKSSAPCGASLMFVDKKDPEDSLRPVVDYRGLNKVTVPVRHPIPLINELQDRLQGSKFYTKIDLKTGFNLVRVAKGHEWKTAFRCKYGLYEYRVMPLGLINAPATFQAMMNHIFKDLIDSGLLVYLDDLLIYSDSREKHDELVKEVLRRLSKHNLAVAPQKCQWGVDKVEFLGYIISPTGIHMSLEKAKCISQWERPTSLKGVQRFIGFANFYRRFIKAFSKIAKPLTDSVKRTKAEWEWNPEMERAFLELKQAFSEAPVLIHFNPEMPAIVEADASDFALGAVLSQRASDGKLHPVAFHSRKLTPAEVNYEIHDKELLAIVDSFARWRQYLEGAKHRIDVFSDHQNLSYFTTAKILNRRQARWAQQLASYWFIIHYRPGRQNDKADVLSRLPQHQPEKGGAEDQPITTVLQDKHFASPAAIFESSPAPLLSSARLCSVSTPEWTNQFISQVRSQGQEDKEYREQLLRPLSPVEVREGLLYRKNRLWVPKALQKAVMESEHDTKVAGHMGTDKTLELISRNFWWPGMEKIVRSYVRSCLECQRNKSPRHAPAGFLQPLELRYSPWQAVAMDFITDLPESDGCDSIWVMVDPFTKMAHFIPLKKDEKRAEDLIRIFAREYWRLHGVPRDIISDRDSRFTSRLWKDFLKLVGISSRMSTAFHPQTDGQTERVNQTLEIYLRAFVNYEMSNWKDLLPAAEFAYNNSSSTATSLTPFYANYGFHPSANNPPEESSRNPGSRAYAHWMIQVHAKAIKHLKGSRDRMKKWADKHRSSPPVYCEGQLVMLNARNIRTKRPSKKLDKKMLGPFRVTEVLSPTAVRLALPVRWRIHNSFHVSLLEPYRAGIQHQPDPDQVLREADPVEGEDYEVEQIKDAMSESGTIKYLVKWKGWPEKRHWTWEPYEHFFTDEARQLLVEFRRDHPHKPFDPRIAT